MLRAAARHASRPASCQPPSNYPQLPSSHPSTRPSNPLLASSRARHRPCFQGGCTATARLLAQAAWGGSNREWRGLAARDGGVGRRDGHRVASAAAAALSGLLAGLACTPTGAPTASTHPRRTSGAPEGGKDRWAGVGRRVSRGGAAGGTPPVSRRCLLPCIMLAASCTTHRSPALPCLLPSANPAHRQGPGQGVTHGHALANGHGAGLQGAGQGTQGCGQGSRSSGVPAARRSPLMPSQGPQVRAQGSRRQRPWPRSCGRQMPWRRPAWYVGHKRAGEPEALTTREPRDAQKTVAGPPPAPAQPAHLGAGDALAGGKGVGGSLAERE